MLIRFKQVMFVLIGMYVLLIFAAYIHHLASPTASTVYLVNTASSRPQTHKIAATPSSRVVKLIVQIKSEGYQVEGSGIVLNSKGDILTAMHTYTDAKDTGETDLTWKIIDDQKKEIELPLDCDIKRPEWDICVIKHTSIKKTEVTFGKVKKNAKLEGFLPEDGYFKEPIQFIKQRNASYDGQWMLLEQSKQRLDQYKIQEKDWGGSSGGAVWNDKHELIGMMVAMNEAHAFIVPAEWLVKILNQYHYKFKLKT